MMFNKYPFNVKEESLVKFLYSKGKKIDEVGAIKDVVTKVIKECSSCTRKYNSSGPIPPLLLENSEILVVTRSPNRLDDLKGGLLAEGSYIDTLLWKMMEELGIKDKRVSITSVCHCPNKKGRKTEPLDDEDINQCAKWKSLEEKVIGDVRVVLLLGDDACRLILNNRFNVVKGKYYQINNKLIIPVPHPGSFQLEQSLKDLFDRMAPFYKEKIKERLEKEG